MIKVNNYRDESQYASNANKDAKDPKAPGAKEGDVQSEDPTSE